MEYQNTLREEDREFDNNSWFKPKRESHMIFMEGVDDWLKACDKNGDEGEMAQRTAFQ